MDPKAALRVEAAFAAFARVEATANLRLETLQLHRKLLGQSLDTMRADLGRLGAEPENDPQRERLQGLIQSLLVRLDGLDQDVATQMGPGTERRLSSLQSELEAIGPGAKRLLLKLARDPDPRIPIIAAAAHDHLRREQLWLMFAAVVGKDHGPADTLFAELMDVPFAADRLEAVADDVDDPAELYARWRGELAARRNVSAPEIAAWLLLGTHPATRPHTAPDYPFIDPTRNSDLARALNDRTTSRPLRRLTTVWAEVHPNDAAARLAASRLLGNRK